jgi:membrane protease subunit HflC
MATDAEAAAADRTDQAMGGRLRRNIWTVVVAVLLAVVLLFYLFSYQVPAGYAGVVRRLGGIIEPVDTDPGLAFRWPAPIDKVELLDMRTRLVNTQPMEGVNKDKINLVLTFSVGWRIVDPAGFVKRLKTIEEAEENLENRVDSIRNDVLGEYSLSDLVNPEFSEQSENWRDFEQRMRERLNQDLENAGWPVTVDTLLLRQMAFPTETTEAVFARMKAEREEESKEFRSRGESEATKIVAEAEAEARSIVAEARATAEITRGKADAEAAEHYGVFKQNPTLANYLRGVQSLRTVLGKQATILLYTDHAPFNLLEGDAVPHISSSGDRADGQGGADLLDDSRRAGSDRE